MSKMLCNLIAHRRQLKADFYNQDCYAECQSPTETLRFKSQVNVLNMTAAARFSEKVMPYSCESSGLTREDFGGRGDGALLN